MNIKIFLINFFYLTAVTPIYDTERIREDLINFIGENGPALAAITTLAAFTPPPLSMFPPQGLPQPGSIGGGAGGGGALPSAALSVGEIDYF